MKFSCEKSLLAAAVNTASRAAAAKSAVPGLDGLLLDALDGVTVTGYDLKIGIRSSLPADVEEMGSVVLNCKLFGDIIRKLPDDVVTVTVKPDSSAEIVCGMSRFSILGMSGKDYPDLPDVKSQNYLRIKEKDLREMIGETRFAISDNEARPIHTGALFEVDGSALTVVAVDGYRLALRRGTLTENKIVDNSFVVPGNCLGEAEKIASAESEDEVRLTVGVKHVMFTIGRTEIISRRLEGEFLNYKNSLPKDSKYSLRADRRELINAIERVSLIISDKFKSPVRCRFGDGVLKVSTNTTLGTAADECQIGGNAEGLLIGFNNRYILECLRAAPADTVVLKLNNNTAPCLIVPEEGEEFLYMILPVRMRSDEN